MSQLQEKLISDIHSMRSTFVPSYEVLPHLSLTFFSFHYTNSLMLGGNLLCYIKVASLASILALVCLLE
jgi:hypothetical protein